MVSVILEVDNGTLGANELALLDVDLVSEGDLDQVLLHDEPSGLGDVHIGRVVSLVILVKDLDKLLPLLHGRPHVLDLELLDRKRLVDQSLSEELLLLFDLVESPAEVRLLVGVLKLLSIWIEFHLGESHELSRGNLLLIFASWERIQSGYQLHVDSVVVDDLEDDAQIVQVKTGFDPDKLALLWSHNSLLLVLEDLSHLIFAKDIDFLVAEVEAVDGFPDAIDFVCFDENEVLDVIQESRGHNRES